MTWESCQALSSRLNPIYEQHTLDLTPLAGFETDEIDSGR